ncbi:hypothetical protein GCM10025857_20460 [Alicyclobacillus contaminans]|uniref:TatD family hydrolase n=1 Tax=Alicyclobacillus contaminans TaxID=392016 RepID=UPI0003FC443F|nr:TatD family hydrolase [Alicyclobacillus contaminans]GMA50689.1 hypothetical protein GCM10025857_20460 [Alicyclobacillus contaminans]
MNRFRTDTHFHIDQARAPKRVLQAAERAGIRLAAPSMNPDSYAEIRRLQAAHPQALQWVGIGLHPEREYPDAEFLRACRLVEQADVVGEVGLPYYDRVVTRADVDRFATFCRLAAEHNKPMMIHAVHDVAYMALDFLCEYAVKRAVFHWLKADVDTIDAIVDAGYFISITPEVTYRERDMQLLKRIPLTQIVLETDGPYAHGGPYAGLETVPDWIDEAARVVADHYGLSWENWWRQHEINVERLFGVPSRSHEA